MSALYSITYDLQGYKNMIDIFKEKGKWLW